MLSYKLIKTQRTGEGGKQLTGRLDPGGDTPQLEVRTEGPPPCRGREPRNGGAYRAPSFRILPSRRMEGSSQGLASPKGLECTARPSLRVTSFILAPPVAGRILRTRRPRQSLGCPTCIRGRRLSEGREDCRVAGPAGPWLRETLLPALGPQAQLFFLLGTQPHEEILGEAPSPRGGLARRTLPAVPSLAVMRVGAVSQGIPCMSDACNPRGGAG